MARLGAFYRYRRDREPPLTLLREMRLQEPEDDDHLLAYLYTFVNRTAKKVAAHRPAAMV